MLKTRIARLQLVLALLPELGACTASAVGPWQKSGADQATVAKDTSECRTLAEQEALRRYPYGFTSPTFGAAGTVMSQQRDDTNRTTAEVGLFNSCMQDRGYARGAAP
jgi:hypothetical protein